MEETYEIDPDGDTYLVLRNANAPFAVWDPKKDDWPDIMSPEEDEDESMEVDSEDSQDDQEGQPQLLLGNGSGSELELLENGDVDSWADGSTRMPSETPSSPIMPHKDNQQQETPVVRFRLSSKHLILASSYFNRMLKGPWKESNIEPGCDYTISAHDWDVKALLILMNIIHGQARNVPRELSLERLAKFAVIVDYYQCNEVVEIFVDRWLSKIPTPTTYRDMIMRLLVSWIFSESAVFHDMTAMLLYHASGPINFLKLPIPEAILDALERDRKIIVGTLLQLLHDTMDLLAGGPYDCSYECASMLLGVLTGHLYSLHLFPNPPKSPYIGISFYSLVDAIRSIREAYWCGSVMDESRRMESGHLRKCFANRPHNCTVYGLLEPPERPIPNPVGLSLESFTGEAGEFEDDPNDVASSPHDNRETPALMGW